MQPARKPLSAIIAIQADKLRGKPGAKDEPDGDEAESDDAPRDEEARPEMVQACQDAIDAMSKRDAEAFNAAMSHWMDMYQSGGGESE